MRTLAEFRRFAPESRYFIPRHDQTCGKGMAELVVIKLKT
jgi:hypothetical protein